MGLTDAEKVAEWGGGGRLQKVKQCNKIPQQIKSGINSHA